ncbi:MAG: hypothetical protein AAGJ92_05995 [Pseudomonadota bacterium]
MKTILDKAAATVSGIVLFCVACLMAGLGLSVIAFMALFGLAAGFLALLASPFIAMAIPAEKADTAETA